MIDALVLTRWIHFAASLFAAGTVSFAVLVAQPGARMSGADLARLHRRLQLWVWSALFIAFVSGVMWLLLVSADILGLSILDVSVHGGAWIATWPRGRQCTQSGPCGLASRCAKCTSPKGSRGAES